MPHRYQTVLLFGAPGAGKGTQGKILGQIPGFFHLSTGDMFRTLDIHSELGQKFYEYSSKGELVPDDLTVELWKQNLSAQAVLSLFKPHDDLLILDGIPRTVRQAQLVSEYVDVLGVVHLVCLDQESMVKRLRRRALKENRADDGREDVIRNRWGVYERETAPVLQQFPADIIHNVDAIGSPAEVLEHILEVVVPIQNTHFSNVLGE